MMIVETLYAINPLLPDILLLSVLFGFVILLMIFLSLPKDLRKFIIQVFRAKSNRNLVLVFDLPKFSFTLGKRVGNIIEIRDGKITKLMNIPPFGLRTMWGLPATLSISTEGVAIMPEYFVEVQKLADVIGLPETLKFLRAIDQKKRLELKKQAVANSIIGKVLPNIKWTKKDEETLQAINEYINNVIENIKVVVKEHNLKLSLELIEKIVKDKGDTIRTRVFMPINYEVITNAVFGVNGYAVAKTAEAVANVWKKKMSLDAKEIFIILIGAAIFLGLVWSFMHNGQSIDYNQLANAISSAIKSTSTTTQPSVPPSAPMGP